MASRRAGPYLTSVSHMDLLTQLKPRDVLVWHCLVKGQWKMAEIHLEARFVHLFQICHKGCALPPQDVL